jgi:hypothetical protein
LKKDSLVQSLIEDCDIVAEKAQLPVPVAKAWDAGQYIWNWRQIDDSTGFAAEVFLCLFPGEKGSVPRIEIGARVWNVLRRTAQWANTQAVSPRPAPDRDLFRDALLTGLAACWKQAQQAVVRLVESPNPDERALERLEEFTKRAG